MVVVCVAIKWPLERVLWLPVMDYRGAGVGTVFFSYGVLVIIELAVVVSLAAILLFRPAHRLFRWGTSR